MKGFIEGGKGIEAQKNEKFSSDVVSQVFLRIDWGLFITGGSILGLQDSRRVN